MTINKKLLTINGIGLVALVAVSAIAVLKFTDAKTQWNNYQSQVQTKISYVTTMRADMGYGGLIHRFKNFVLRGKDSDAAKFNTKAESTLAAIEGYKAAGTLNANEINALDQVAQMVQEYSDAAKTARVLHDQGKTIHEIDSQIKISDGPYLEGLAMLSDELALQTKSRTGGFSERLNSASTLILTMSTAAALVVIFLGLWVASSIVRPIATLISQITEIQTDNDLTKRVHIRSRDEVGQLADRFNDFVQTLQGVIGDVVQSSHEVTSSATMIATSSKKIATDMEEQASQITQVSSAVEEMSASIIEVARKSSDASDYAKNSGSTAEEGGDVVRETILGMNSIAEAVQNGATSVAELGKRGEQIGQIIEVINDIASQTNLLALNAAIEAARAGEHGRGFAVVADEVRKLADRTTTATDKVTQSIQAIQTETSDAVAKMNTGTEFVTLGVKKATEAGESLEKIVSGTQRVANNVQSIAAASEQQSVAAEEVSKNIESIKSFTAQSSDGAQEAALAVRKLSAKAEALLAVVGKFKIK